MAKGGGKKKGKKDEATEPEHDKRWERVRVRSARDDAKHCFRAHEQSPGDAHSSEYQAAPCSSQPAQPPSPRQTAGVSCPILRLGHSSMSVAGNQAVLIRAQLGLTGAGWCLKSQLCHWTSVALPAARSSCTRCLQLCAAGTGNAALAGGASSAARRPRIAASGAPPVCFVARVSAAS